MSIQQRGLTGNIQDVNASNQALVNVPLNEMQAGFVAMTAECDAGTVTLSRLTRAMEVSNDFRLRVGVDTMMFNENFSANSVNSAVWTTPVNVMTIPISGSMLSLNGGLSTAIGAYAILKTYRHFPIFKQYGTYFEKEVQFSQAPVAGNRCEWGSMLVAGTAVPTDGCYFRLTESGAFQAVANHNGVETTAALSNSLIVPNASATYLVTISSNTAIFWINNIAVAKIEQPVGQGSITSSMNLPMAFRNYNVGIPSAAQVMKIGNTNVTLADQATNKDWSEVVSGAGGASHQGQTGQTMGSTANYANTAAPAAAALTNTTAAAPNIGLGGIINVLPTLTAGTDGILCSFQVPLGTAAIPGKTLYITDLRISSVVTTALIGGPVIYAYSLAYGHTSVSLATPESPTAKAPRRVPLGIQAYLAAAALGTSFSDIDIDYKSGCVTVQPGEFVQIVARNLGMVTTAGVITFVVSVTGYWE